MACTSPCAVTTAGDAICPGESTPPPGRYTAISTSLRRTCAITDAEEAVCWGEGTTPAPSCPIWESCVDRHVDRRGLTHLRPLARGADDQSSSGSRSHAGMSCAACRTLQTSTSASRST